MMRFGYYWRIFIIFISLLLLIAFPEESISQKMSQKQQAWKACERKGIVTNLLNIKELRGKARAYKSQNPFSFFVPSPANPFRPDFICSERQTPSRIVGGDEAVPFSMPWMAFLQSFNSDDDNWFCTGVLISNQWILTAAHCVRSVSELNVYLGTHDLFYTRKENATRIKVHNKSVFRHKDTQTDMALIKLPGPLTWHPNVKPACLPTASQVLNLGDMCTSAGWGANDISNPKLTRTLQKLEVMVKKCKKNTPHICVGVPTGVDKKQDTCSGDSGGPLMCRLNGVQTAVGILSKGSNKCDARRLEAYYTDVRPNLEWIKDVLRKHGL